MSQIMFFAPTDDQVNMYDNEGSTKNRLHLISWSELLASRGKTTCLQEHLLANKH